MNSLQNSIVRFLKYVIELENLIKYRVPILPQSIIHSRQVPSIDFCYAGEGVEAVHNRKPLIIYLSRNGRTLKLLLLFLLFLFYTNSN